MYCDAADLACSGGEAAEGTWDRRLHQEPVTNSKSPSSDHIQRCTSHAFKHAGFSEISISDQATNHARHAAPQKQKQTKIRLRKQWLCISDSVLIQWILF